MKKGEDPPHPPLNLKSNTKTFCCVGGHIYLLEIDTIHALSLSHTVFKKFQSISNISPREKERERIEFFKDCFTRFQPSYAAGVHSIAAYVNLFWAKSYFIFIKERLVV